MVSVVVWVLVVVGVAVSVSVWVLVVVLVSVLVSVVVGVSVLVSVVVGVSVGVVVGVSVVRRTVRPRKRRRGKNASLTRLADKLWSQRIRSIGYCQMVLHWFGDNATPQPRAHSSVLQAAHGFSRRYRGTRWDTLNGFCLCSACHVAYTYNPLAWDDFLREAWGPTLYEQLRAQALATTKPDMAEVLARLQG